MKFLKKKLVLFGGAVGFGGLSVGAFAQASAPFNDATMVASIGGVTPIVQDVGGAMLGVMVAVFAVKLALRMVGR